VEDEPGGLSWWGRELTKMEREGMLAQVREQFGADAALEAQQSHERSRWLRGRLRSVGAGFEVEVNSEERLTLLLELLAEHGIEAKLKRRPSSRRCCANSSTTSISFTARRGRLGTSTGCGWSWLGMDPELP
jgi:hypothetical protein